jgi:hypothetical protein
VVPNPFAVLVGYDPAPVLVTANGRIIVPTYRAERGGRERNEIPVGGVSATL